jgi:dCTP deaminase
MILTDREIRLALQEGHIEVKPTPDLSVAITSTAMDLTLGNVFKTWPKVSGMSIRPGDKDYKYSDYAKFQELWAESRFSL